MAVDPEKVKELREKSGLPMMECKRALEKAGGHIELALEELRKAGHKAQEKLSGRAANKGRIGCCLSADGKVGVLVALRCETEPVGENESFKGLLAEVVEAVYKGSPKDAAALQGLHLASGKTVSAGVTELINRIRENISVGQFVRLEGDAVIQYVHFDNKKAAMVALKGASVSNPKVVEVGKELGMHIVFACLSKETTPLSLSRDGLDPAIVEKERSILLEAAKSDPKNARKPEDILRKMVEGQINKFIASKCLLEQPYARDPKLTVSQFLKGSGTGVAIEKYAYVATDQA